ncbi:hypothetical protein B0H19DRAFT_1274518 [Mycena capillaripes]|nr:hypothetical protein B0H19DRAFT_1274518 [Mycena capillaripes]
MDLRGHLQQSPTQSILNLVYLRDDHDGKKDHPIPNVVKDPIGYRLNDWRRNIGRKSIEAMQAMIDAARAEPDPANNDDKDEADGEQPAPKSVAEYVRWALHVEDHMSPFHWRRWGNAKKKEGLFETDLIAYTYAAHPIAVKAIPPRYTPSQNLSSPIAALILCIQAEVDGKHAKDRRASKYVATLLELTEERWAAINDRSMRWVDPKKRAGSSRSSSMDGTACLSDEDNHFVLKADA